MIEGPQAFQRFESAMKKVLAVPHSEIQRRIEEHRKAKGQVLASFPVGVEVCGLSKLRAVDSEVFC